MNYDNITKENFNNYSEQFWTMLFQIDMFLFENDELESNEHSNYNELGCIYWYPNGTDYNNIAFDILSDHNLSVAERFKKVFDEVDLVFKYLFKFSHDNNIFFPFCSSKVYENTFEDRFKDYENKFIDVEKIEFVKNEVKTITNSKIFRFNLLSIENQTIVKNAKIKKIEFLQSISRDFNINIIKNDDLDLLNFNNYRVEIDKVVIKSEQSEPEPLDLSETSAVGKPSFVNEFDGVPESKVIEYFTKNLVENKHLTKETLTAYLKQAFELKTPPKQKYSFENIKTKEKIVSVFYKYYKETADKPHGKQQMYLDLLKFYFSGFEKTNIRNFSK